MKRTMPVIIAVLIALAGIFPAGNVKAEAPAARDMIGIIGAMDMEIESLKEAMDVATTTVIANMVFHEGKLGNKNVIVVKCGVGKVNAGICAQVLINTFGCTKIINTGVAGSLDNQINIGDIVVSLDAVQHDFDASAIGFKKGEIPYSGFQAFPADETMRKQAAEAVREAAPEVSVFEGRVCSGDQFISTAEQKEQIIGEFGGMCCEMEGAAVAQVCCLNQVPFVIIRAISEKNDGSAAVEYETFAEAAAAHCAKIVQYMVEKN